MRHLRWVLAFLLATTLSAATNTSGPTSTNNDETCDIGLFPAATLLLPFFEVDLNPANPAGGQTTIFTVTNTTRLPQAVLVTLWTDRGYPVIAFNIYLTGYDVQSINLFDVFVRGRIAPDDGTGFDVSPVGEMSRSAPDRPFDNPQLNEASCAPLPVQLADGYVARLQQAFTQGTFPQLGELEACTEIGGRHQNAMGYATIDVIGSCTTSLPIDESYFRSEIRYDNVLMGDYLQVDGSNDFAQGSPMVHIRAIPEGGTRETRRATNFRRTFYSRLQPAASRISDGRQPLPSTFAARWIAGSGADFDTFFKIWREVDTPATAACEPYAANKAMPIAEVVRFDEEENPETTTIESLITPPIDLQVLPAAYLLPIGDEGVIPFNPTDAIGGWIYFNLHNGRDGTIASQNWVVTSMRSEDRFSADMDALALGNGCTPVTSLTKALVKSGPHIGPAENTTP